MIQHGCPLKPTNCDCKKRFMKYFKTMRKKDSFTGTSLQKRGIIHDRTCPEFSDIVGALWEDGQLYYEEISFGRCGNAYRLWRKKFPRKIARLKKKIARLQKQNKELLEEKRKAIKHGTWSKLP